MGHREILSLSQADSGSTKLNANAVLVDICGAVYDDSHWRRWLFHLLLKMGLHTNYVAFYRLWEQEHLSQVKLGRRVFDDALREFLVSAGLTPAQAAEVGIALKARKQQFDLMLCPMPGVESTLRKMKLDGFRIAGLVNSCEVARQRLQKHPISGAFEKLFHCSELRRGPGEENCYRDSLCEWAGCGPELIALLSQDEWELERAAAAGLQTIAVNFDGAVNADAHLEHLAEVEQVVCLPGPQRLAG